MKEYYVSYRYENGSEVSVGVLCGATPQQVANDVIKNIFKINNAKASKIRECDIDDYRTVIGVKSYSNGNHMNYYTLEYKILM